MEAPFKKQKLYHLNFQNQEIASSIASELPEELILNIFSLLSAYDLHRTIQVDSIWNRLSQESLKDILFFKDARILTPHKWNIKFGNNCISEEESDEAFATMRLDLDLIRSPTDSSKKLIDTHVIAYVPKEIDGEKFEKRSYNELLKNKFLHVLSRDEIEDDDDSCYVLREASDRAAFFQGNLYGGEFKRIVTGADRHGWMALGKTIKQWDLSNKNTLIPLFMPTLAIISMHYLNSGDVIKGSTHVLESSRSKNKTVKMHELGPAIHIGQFPFDKLFIPSYAPLMILSKHEEKVDGFF